MYPYAQHWRSVSAGLLLLWRSYLKGISLVLWLGRCDVASFHVFAQFRVVLGLIILHVWVNICIDRWSISLSRYYVFYCTFVLKCNCSCSTEEEKKTVHLRHSCVYECSSETYFTGLSIKRGGIFIIHTIYIDAMFT